MLFRFADSNSPHPGSMPEVGGFARSAHGLTPVVTCVRETPTESGWHPRPRNTDSPTPIRWITLNLEMTKLADATKRW